ncbi:MAG: sigma-54-dependent Fis family transcriptional regulator [Phycisphaerae bacterium]|jgi:two-component system response regulator HydG|nr:sigma-54-dependent Fis family transcriptional regulator [Phycisphaerae bacterium]HQL53760.1 sigma-54 dependent transcriptional regulator [Phycisphaerae bacterium]
MPQTAFILVLTDDEARGQRLREVLREKFGHVCSVVQALREALDSIRARPPDVVLTHPQVGGAPTLAPLAELLDGVSRDAALLVRGTAELPQVRHIHLASIADTADVDTLAQTVSTAARRAVARREDRLLKDSIADQQAEAFEGIVGVSPAMRRIVERIKKAARNKLTVLILGETGTGKDLIAEAIHRQSDRAARPMKSVNCAGLNENLLESELFGHVRGAFTGAVSDRKGYFVAADGGTLFLDEIGDMPPAMQAKFLRALERREITPVGSTDVRRVDVRVIAATNVDLQKYVEDNKFREDLYYRLNQWVIEVPPLRERRDDIPILADYLRQRANKAHGATCTGISSEAMGYLTKYYWPGNVRELANVIEAIVVEAENRQLEADDLPERIRGSREIVPASASGMVGLTMAQVERMMIERTLQATHGNREQAAKILDIGTRTLYRKIKEYGL